MLDKKFEIQEILSLGYVYLLILGIFHNSIYYNFLGINFLDYSSILDVLLSPLALLLNSKLLFFSVFGCVILCLLYAKYMPRFLKKSKSFKKNQTEAKQAKIDKSIEAFKSPRIVILMTALMVFSMFIGLGVGRGLNISKRLENINFNYNYELIFNDGNKERIKILGKNSLYVFYVEEGKSEVLISPIEGNIKTIRKIGGK